MSITVLGNGAMGSVVADDLAARGYNVTRADATLGHDLSRPWGVAAAIDDAELVVCALPSELGYSAVETAIQCGVRWVVDLSFTALDLRALHDQAKVMGTTVLHDCGLSPGLSNLIVGHMAPKQYATIMVGGIAAERDRDYVVTWSIDDLREEYTRPAQYRQDEVAYLQDPMDPGKLSTVKVPGVGALEAFRSDGLRSLLRMRVPTLVEYTLRWPGHVARVTPYLDQLGDVLTDTTSQDMVVLTVECDGAAVGLVDYGTDTHTAMARTTALSCSAFAQLLLGGYYPTLGVHPPEAVGANRAAYEYVVTKLATHGIKIALDRSRTCTA